MDMELTDIAQLSKEELLELLKVSFKTTQNVDGHWYLGLEALLGPEKAIEVDTDVWAKLSKAEAYRMQRSFDFGQGLPALAKAIRVSPSLNAFTFGGHQVIRESENSLLLRVTNCVSQSSRVRTGLGVFDCREVGYCTFQNFASGYIPSARVERLASPPDIWSPERWCEWRIVVDGDTICQEPS